MMNRSTCLPFLIALLLMLAAVAPAEAQLREDLRRSGDWTGPVFRTSGQGDNALSRWLSSVDMDMGHSYSMSFGSVGGQYQNLNAYTNHMQFRFNEKLTGNVDVSLLHSPFGGNMAATGMGTSPLGGQVVIDRAQLDYQLSPNTHLSIQFSQRPWSSYGYGYGAGTYLNRRHRLGY